MTAPSPPNPSPPRGRAALYRLISKPGGRAGEDGTQVADENTINVQFNPATLRLSHAAGLDVGGRTNGSQARQHTGVGRSTLSLELEFDTTEEPGDPVDVRTLTDRVRQFAQAPRDGSSPAPPPVLFVFGTFRFRGVIKQLGEELDYFLPPDSTPARAKLTLTIEEADDRVERAKAGPAARTAANGTEPGRSGGGPATPGSGPTTNPTRTVPAQAGESAAAIAARVGGNPAAWRSVMGGQSDPLNLPAGAPIQVGPEIAAPTTALGGAAGFAAGGVAGGVSEVAAALGLPPSPGGTGAGVGGGPGGATSPPSVGDVAAAGRDAGLAAGFALAAAGGLAAAAARVAADQVARSQAAVRAAFDVPAGAARPAALPAALATAVDPRALSYGRSVPLRPAVNAANATNATNAVTRLGGGPGDEPSWVRLPPEAPRNPNRRR